MLFRSGSQESTKAEQLIAYINNKVPELKVEEDRTIAQDIYKADTTTTRTFVIIVKDPSMNLNQVTFDVISYNIDNYTNKNYRTEGSLVEKKFLMITVSGFQTYAQALKYYSEFDLLKQIRNPAGARLVSFIISSDNLKNFMKDKDPDRYEAFFRENILKVALTGVSPIK